MKRWRYASNDMTTIPSPDVELQTTRERLDLALEASELGTFYCPLPFGALEWNAKCKEHFWLPPDAEVSIDQFFDIIHPDDREHTRLAIESTLNERQRYDIAYRTVSPEGKIRWIRAIGRGFYDETGRPTRFDGITVDITSSKEIEQELRHQQQLYEEIARRLEFLNGISEETRELTSPAEVMSIISERLGLFLGVNRCAYAVVHLDEDGFTIMDNFTDGCGSIVGDFRLSGFGREIYSDLRAGKTIVINDVDTHLAPNDGAEALKVVDVRALICCPLIKKGKLAALMAVHHMQPRVWKTNEITLLEEVVERSWNYIERVYSNLALTESELRFRSLVGATALIVWQADKHGNILSEVAGWETFTGQTRAQYSGRGWMDAVHPDDRGHMGDSWKQSDPPGLKFQATVRIRRRDGVFRRMLIIGVPVLDVAGLIREWVGTCTDIEDKLTLEDQRERIIHAERTARTEAERASRMKDEFLATLSHELRTPLSAILGWAQILRDDAGLPPQLQEAAKIIERNARMQAQIIDDLLDMNRIISGKVRLDVQHVELSKIIESSVETVRPAATAKGVRLQPILDGSAGPVSGDPNRLQQVFWNLLSNAIKFTPRGGRVQIILQRVDSHIEVSVADNGEGLAPEFLPYVFDRFVQADSSSTRGHGGLGLGLAIVRQLVELHGGSVHAESPGPHQGATFTVSLPLLPIHAHPPAERRHPKSLPEKPRPLESLPRLDGVRVLVVDDEPDARALSCHLLTAQGAEVQMADCAAEAFEMLRKNPPSVLLSDIGMPREDGISLIKRIRQLPAEQGGAVPAIALTAYARSEDRTSAVLAGFQMHVAKPVETGELLAVVASLVGRV
ncbi:PAS domain S-box-containing protein [Terrimicrobium sacchariphilum]|uniref:histidine kinase n=1 Tax=Terrimicrobium sacchariphilum TaxID=690879 RepID=A0A146GEP8_TERSA|nr:ATP-binding protein [Terrimicrobium sacchariphilum]GAT34958.1 PAS domain S-box-containing protein [Terrimicrobium sacchariphilum]